MCTCIHDVILIDVHSRGMPVRGLRYATRLTLPRTHARLLMFALFYFSICSFVDLRERARIVCQRLSRGSMRSINIFLFIGVFNLAIGIWFVCRAFQFSACVIYISLLIFLFNWQFPLFPLEYWISIISFICWWINELWNFWQFWMSQCAELFLISS